MTYDRFRTAIAKWAAYRRTRDELSRLPIDVALDIDILPRDAATVAHRAVYGA